MKLSERLRDVQRYAINLSDPARAACGQGADRIEQLETALTAIINRDKRYHENCTSQDTGYDGPCAVIARSALSAGQCGEDQ